MGTFVEMMRFVYENKVFSKGNTIKRFRVSQDVWDDLMKMKPYDGMPDIDPNSVDFEGVPVLLDANLDSGTILKEYEV